MSKLIIFIVFIVTIAGTQAIANPIHVPNHHEREMQSFIHDSAHAVDEAWEAFHRSALGGTLASPAVQVDIELSLHKARELLIKANDSMDRGDKESVVRLSSEIRQITDHVKRESQRKKQ